LNGQAFSQTVTPEEAAKMVGEEVVLRGTVFAMGFTQAKSGNMYKNLFFGDDTPHHVFRVRYRLEGLPGAEHLPEEMVLREVRVRGKVVATEGSPRITVTQASQIEMLPVDVEAALRTSGDSEAQRNLYTLACAEILLKEDYAALEKLATELMKTEARFVCGLWKITPFMTGLSDPESKDDEDWSKHQKALEQWAKAFPDSATQRIAWASYLISYGWKARGGGYADTVTQEGWQLFREHFNQARAVLDELPRAEWSPFAYMRRITIGMGLGEGTEEIVPIFDEGVERWPEYYDLYFAEAFRLMPRWHGKAGEWLEWLSRKTTPENEVTDEIYARVTWEQVIFYWKEGVFKATQVDWTRVKRGFAVMGKKYPDSWWNLSAFARLAYMADDRSTAVEIIKDLDGHEVTSVWGGRTFYEEFKRWAEGSEEQ
jgi:hypothetical protein